MKDKKNAKQTIKKKLSYFWDYYRFHMFAGIFVLILAVAGICFSVQNNKPVFLNGYFLNSNWGDDLSRKMLEDYASFKGCDLDKHKAYFNSSVYIDTQLKDQMSSVAYTKVMSEFDMKRVDFFFANQTIFDYFGPKEAFLDLEKNLPNDLLEKYQDNLIKTQQYDENDKVVGEYVAGIDVSNTKKLKEYEKSRKMYEDSPVIFSVAYNTIRLEEVMDFLRWLEE